jgi:penicillin-insensitive murein DD-endopeptidase
LLVAGALVAAGAGADLRAEELPASSSIPSSAGPSSAAHRSSSGPTSLSCGAANRGALFGAQALAARGSGFVTPEPWQARGLRFGTADLVGLIERVAVQVARRYPGGELAVADLSAEEGGPVARHRSHQSGRDVDLIYYAIDPAGDPMPNDGHMPMFGPDGRASRATSPEPAPRIQERYFDMARNWALVEALVSDPDVRVARIFVSRRVRDWLLAYARAAQVPEELVSRATAVLAYPGDGDGHADHMHVHIACSAVDQAEGRCSDSPAPRRRRDKWRTRIKCGPASSAAVAGR